MFKSRTSQKGFTLIEILLVIALIAILAGIVIFAINVPKQLADARNAQRRTDVNTILNAVYQYSIDHNGAFPDTINQYSNCAGFTNNEICKTPGNCSGLTDLSVLTDNQKYLAAMPTDPTNSNYGSGYFITSNDNHRITVCANAENDATISVSR